MEEAEISFSGGRVNGLKINLVTTVIGMVLTGAITYGMTAGKYLVKFERVETDIVEINKRIERDEQEMKELKQAIGEAKSANELNSHDILNLQGTLQQTETDVRELRAGKH